jgi:hypothetical protein
VNARQRSRPQRTFWLRPRALCPWSRGMYAYVRFASGETRACVAGKTACVAHGIVCEYANKEMCLCIFIISPAPCESVNWKGAVPPRRTRTTPRAHVFKTAAEVLAADRGVIIPDSHCLSTEIPRRVPQRLTIFPNAHWRKGVHVPCSHFRCALGCVAIQDRHCPIGPPPRVTK